MRSWSRFVLIVLAVALAIAAMVVAGCAGPDTSASSSDPVAAPGQTVEQPASKPAALEGVDWTAVAFDNAEEALVPVVAGTKVTARFEDGRIKGNTGVNVYEGDYSVDGESLIIGPAFQVTERAGLLEAMDQESAYLAALGRTKTYGIENGTLTLLDKDGIRLVAFE